MIIDINFISYFYYSATQSRNIQTHISYQSLTTSHPTFFDKTFLFLSLLLLYDIKFYI